MIIHAVTVTDNVSVPLLTAIAVAVGAFANKLLETWRAKAQSEAEAAAAAAKAAIDAAQVEATAKLAAERIDRVEAPKVESEGWVAFAASIQANAEAQVSRMISEMERQREQFEERLADVEGQLVQLRAEVSDKTSQLAAKDAVIREREVTIRNRDQALEQRDGVIQRLRSHAALLSNLVSHLGGELPEFHDDQTIAPERREPTIAMPASTTITEKDHS